MSKNNSKVKHTFLIPFIAGLVVMALIGVGVWFLFFKNGGVFSGGKYEFVYELNGEFVTVKADDYDSLIDKLLENPKRDNYEFAGYYLDNTFQTQLTKENLTSKLTKLKDGEKLRISLKWYSVKNTEVPSFLRYEIMDNGVKLTGTKDTSITDLVIPDMINGSPVIEIGDDAFYECKNLVNVTISSNVEIIGGNAFYSVKNRKISYLGNVAQWCNAAYDRNLSDYKLPIYLGAGVEFFVDNKKVTDLIIPEGVGDIRNGTFYGLDVNNLILLGQGIYIHEDAFGSINRIFYKSFKKLFDVANHKHISTYDEGYNSFYTAVSTAQKYKYSETSPSQKHDKLEDFFEVIASIDDSLLVNKNEAITGYWHYVDGKITIWNYFEDDNFEYVSYADNNAAVVGIKNSNSDNITIPKQVGGKNILYLENRAFYDSKIKSLDLGNIEYIGRWALANCSNLEEITISKKLKNITHNAFSVGNASESGKKLRKIYYEGTIVDWHNITLGNRYSSPTGYGYELYVENNKKVELLDFSSAEFSSLSEVNKYSFWGCVGIKTLIIPANITKFGTKVFGGWANGNYENTISKVYYMGTQEQWINVSKSDNGNYLKPVYFYIENEADVPQDGGNYWHYDTDGVTPVVWE